MGIRINKALGWILINETLDLSVLSEMTLDDLKQKHLTQHEALKFDLSYPNLDLSSSLENYVQCVNDEDQTKDKIYLFSPPAVSEMYKWDRSDSPIDYHEFEGIDATPRIKWVHNEILPYAQKFVVTESLKDLNSQQRDTCQMFNELGDKLRPEVKETLKGLGINISLPLKAQIHMTCPKVLELIYKEVGGREYKNLRPGVITYWG